MKLRIKGNSLRLRLNKNDIFLLGEDGQVFETVRFGPDSKLTYWLKADNLPEVQATFEHDTITVRVPVETIREWVGSEQVGFEAEQDTGNGERLRILVEKDYACLTARPGEDDSDAYTNPNTSC